MKMALKTFIEERGEELVGKNLYRNFVLHCCNLLECGVIGPAGVHTAITQLQVFIRERALSLQKWRAQRAAWRLRNPEAIVAAAAPKAERKDFSGLFKASGSGSAAAEEKPEAEEKNDTDTASGSRSNKEESQKQKDSMKPSTQTVTAKSS